MYSKFFKRFFDILFSILALIILFPLLLILTIVGAIAMKGNPFFVQPRPGKKGKDGKEKIFKLIKFRTMSNAKDEDGKLLSDSVRLNKYGRFLRSTSLDELPELVNILKGEMSFVGPRPQLVRDLVFMTEEQRERHSVRQGLTGLAQCSGRNSISWEEKFEYDLLYIKNITFFSDVKILIKTVLKVFQKDGISKEGFETSEDLGDYLMRNDYIDEEFYNEKNFEAIKLLKVSC